MFKYFKRMYNFINALHKSYQFVELYKKFKKSKSYEDFKNFVFEIAIWDDFPIAINKGSIDNVVICDEFDLYYDIGRRNSNTNNEISSEISNIVNTSECGAYTCLDELHMPKIYFCKDILLRCVLDSRNLGLNLFENYSLVTCILHEFWHYHQMEHIISNAGHSYLDKVLDAENKFKYGSSPLEIGAYRYGATMGEKKQDLDEMINEYNKILNPVA